MNLAVAVGKAGEVVTVVSGTAVATATGVGARAEAYANNKKGNVATATASAAPDATVLAIADSRLGGKNAAATSTADGMSNASTAIARALISPEALNPIATSTSSEIGRATSIIEGKTIATATATAT